MKDFKKKAFSYVTFGKIFGHLFVVMEPKIFYHRMLEKQGKQNMFVKQLKLTLPLRVLKKFQRTVLYFSLQITRVMPMFRFCCMH